MMWYDRRTGVSLGVEMVGKTAADDLYSRRELLAGMQMIDWALTQMYYYGPGAEAKIGRGRGAEPDPQAQQAVRLLRLVKGMGHHRFRDHIADLAPAHAEGERLGQEAAQITDYKRSHDLIWTECFMNLCCELHDDGFKLKPDWKDMAVIIWTNIGEEIREGVAPDFESFEETAQRLDSPRRE